MNIQRCYACGNDPYRASYQHHMADRRGHYQQRYRRGNVHYVAYHDTVWGVPIYDDERLFTELMVRAIGGFIPSLYFLENDSYEVLLKTFDPHDINEYERSDVAMLRGRFGHKQADALMENVRCYFSLAENHGSLSALLWGFVNGQTIHNQQRDEKKIPVRSQASSLMSDGLKQYGFYHVSSKACYAFMQAVGMVNDHLVDCFRYQALKRR